MNYDILGGYLIGYFSGVAICWLLMYRPKKKKDKWTIEGLSSKEYNKVIARKQEK